ncbi:MAG: NAD(P)/FAD-dependent oxidoreductase [Nocardioidaceae bacterium]
MNYGGLSLWHETCGEDLCPRAPLISSTDADVAIVGAGFTGLWTAYYLKLADPSLRVIVIERDIAGFGASGRNGGWLSALFPTSRERLAAMPGSSRDLADHMTKTMRNGIDEVGRVTVEEGIDAHFHKGGQLVFARSQSQLVRARKEVDASRAWGDDDDDLRLLTASEAAEHALATELLGATFTPHCARIHPGRLVRGLARAVERRGVMIYEQTPVIDIAPSSITTQVATVRADYVVRATEGYTHTLAGFRRDLVPLYSLMVATQPLPTDVWEHIGLAHRQTFSDHRHLIIYGQRTQDDRLAFGGRGAPYHFASSTSPAHDRKQRVFASLRETLTDMFPVLAGVTFTHEWGGALGVPRDWTPSVGLDQRTGIGWAGGYVGDGVTTTNLAGRTLADLIVGNPTELTTLPWVEHRSPRWEPEPLRWLGINAGLRVMAVADQEERATGRPSLISKAMAPLLGGH